jgi:hypothetical protein
MKINKFTNESVKYNTDVKEFVEEFLGSLDDDIPDWISNVSKRYNIKEFKNSNTPSFANRNNLTSYQEYLSIDKKIDSLHESIRKLENRRDSLQIKVGGELLYNFQKHLLESNFKLFYELFINDSFVDNESTDINNTEIHPNILKKYGDRINVLLDANKYNI